MDYRLQNIIDNNSIHFDKWIATINKFDDLARDLNRTDDFENYQNISREAVNVLAGVFEMCKTYGRFKDDWDYSSYYENLYGVDLIIESKKMNTRFFLGLDNKGFYLRADLNNEENLRNMKDDFWKKLLSLKDYEGFEYEEREGFSRETKRQYPELFHTYKGMIFRIFRKYFLDITDTSVYNNGVGCLGEFRVSWTGKTPFEIILAELCQVFKILYELKYALWKVDDLRK